MNLELKISKISKVSFTISVLSTDLIKTKIETIRELFNCKTELESDIQIIFNGKVLNHNTTFESNGLKNGDKLVMLEKMKKKAQSTAPPVQSVQPIQPIQPIQPTVPPVQPDQPAQSTQSNTHTNLNNQGYWQREVSQQDTQQIYSFEDIYAIFGICTSLILNNSLNNPINYLEFVSVINNQRMFTDLVTREIMRPQNESILRNFLNNSQRFSQSLRANRGNLRIQTFIDPNTGRVDIVLPANNQNQPNQPNQLNQQTEQTEQPNQPNQPNQTEQTEQPNQSNQLINQQIGQPNENEENEENEENDEEDEEDMSEEEMLNQFSDLAQSLGIHGGGNNTVSNVSNMSNISMQDLTLIGNLLGFLNNGTGLNVNDVELNDTDLQNIQTISQIANVSEEIAKRKYIQCGKNIEYTIDMIFGAR